MNERLQQLAKSALTVTKDKPEKFPELLARLIIQDCIKICYEVQKDSDYYKQNSIEYKEGYEIASAECRAGMKKAFDIS